MPFTFYLKIFKQENKMKKINQLLLATCIFAISNIASAAIITGTINFSSETNAFWTPVDGAWNSTTLAASTGMAFTAGDNGFDQNITGGTGTFTGMENTGVDFKDFQFDPLAAGTPLWEFDFGVTTYTFTMNTVSFLSKGGSTILLEGTGYMLQTVRDQYQESSVCFRFL